MPSLQGWDRYVLSRKQKIRSGVLKKVKVFLMKGSANILHSDIENARSVRNRRSELKHKIKNGSMTVDEVFLMGNDYLKYFANMKVYEFICAIPGFGPVSAEKLLAKLKISHCKKLKGLGKKQSEDFFGYFNIKSP